LTRRNEAASISATNRSELQRQSPRTCENRRRQGAAVDRQGRQNVTSWCSPSKETARSENSRHLPKTAANAPANERIEAIVPCRKQMCLRKGGSATGVLRTPLSESQFWCTTGVNRETTPPVPPSGTTRVPCRSGETDPAQTPGITGPTTDARQRISGRLFTRKASGAGMLAGLPQGRGLHHRSTLIAAVCFSWPSIARHLGAPAFLGVTSAACERSRLRVKRAVDEIATRLLASTTFER
jgi:hypothetical protein